MTMAYEDLTWYKKGLVSIIQGSKKVTGTGTEWLTGGIKQGDVFLVEGQIYEIDKVAGSSTIHLVNAYSGETVASADYMIIPRAKAVILADLALDVRNAVTYWNKRDALFEERIGDIEKQLKKRTIADKLGLYVDEDGDLAQDDEHIVPEDPDIDPDLDIATDEQVQEAIDDAFSDPDAEDTD